ncbi:MAG: MlaD family protein, partial [Mangrovicoccus sp.]|nr:MlaD family protein [Mangrovicoccus sp.]
MSDSDPGPGPAEMVTAPRRNMLSGLSYVWLVPFVALLIALGIAWQAVSARGPLIEVRFDAAAGIRPETTELRFRDVRVGMVERIRFAEDMSDVRVEIRVDKEIAPFIDENAQFWIVKPQVSARGVTGLDTVLSGSYIEGTWDDQRGQSQRAFDGLEQAPLVRAGQKGLQVVLRAPDGGQLGAGAPIIYRGVRVGHIEEPHLSESGDAVEARAFIAAPHDRLITSGTRFWEASGFSVNLGTGGVSLDIASLATLVEGGVSFSSVSSQAEPVANGTVFSVYASEEDARESVFSEHEDSDLELTLFFDGSISGLTVGAPVELEGLRVGSVQNFGAFIDQIDGKPEVRLQVDIALQPRRLEMSREAGPDEALNFLADAVSNGLRARLANQGIFNPALKIELVQLPDAAPAEMDLDHVPHPVLPTVPAELSDMTASAEGVLERVQELPFEEVMQSVIGVLHGVEDFLASDGFRKAPDSFVGLMEDARGVIQSEELQTLASDLGKAADEVYDLVAGLNQDEAVSALVAAIGRTEAIMASVQDAVTGLPEIVENLRLLSARAADLPLEELTTRSAELVATTNGILASEHTARVPQALSDALEEFTLVLKEVQGGGLVENANATMASASAAADSVASAVDDL